LALVQRCLEAVALRWGDAVVAVDLETANAARLLKLFGTTARKGDDTPTRPHRRSRLLEVPETVVVSPTEVLIRLAALAPKVPEPDLSAPRRDFDLARWIAEHDLPVVREG